MISETELQHSITTKSEMMTEALLEQIGDLASVYTRAKREQKIGFLLLLVAFFFPWWFGYMGSTTLVFIGIPVLILLIWYGILFMVRNQAVIKSFNQKVEAIIFPLVCSLLGVRGTLAVSPLESRPSFLLNGKFNWQHFIKYLEHAQREAEKLTPALERLKHSQLITESHNTNLVDAQFIVTTEQGTITVDELSIKHTSGSGKNRQTKDIFHGCLATIPLSKTLSGMTFVSTEGDESGFAHLSFFTSGKTEETILEWNEFEDLLHVRTTDEIEARYILSTNFMSQLYDWYSEQKTAVRLSFIGNTLYVLFPDAKIRLHSTMDVLTEKEVSEYALSIARPLRHLLLLAKEVKL